MHLRSFKKTNVLANAFISVIKNIKPFFTKGSYPLKLDTNEDRFNIVS